MLSGKTEVSRSRISLPSPCDSGGNLTCGFCPGPGTVNQIFTIVQLLRGLYEFDSLMFCRCLVITHFGPWPQEGNVSLCSPQMFLSIGFAAAGVLGAIYSLSAASLGLANGPVCLWSITDSANPQWGRPFANRCVFLVQTAINYL